MKTWLNKPISQVCETFISPSKQCASPTAYAYKVRRSGWMSLCQLHAASHLDIAIPIDELINNGEEFQGSIVMPSGIITHNASHEPCDMADGPCCCGAWHKLTDWPEPLRTQILAARKERE
jgi:hypothetical protein